ncbi:hypothetical protein [Clostridium algidicarnis]|nr:hypothetical protein [Clostridium algidicarnis]
MVNKFVVHFAESQDVIPWMKIIGIVKDGLVDKFNYPNQIFILKR